MITAHYLLKAGYDVTAYASEIRGESRDFPVRRVGGFPLSRTGRLLAFAYAAPTVARREGNRIVLSFARTIGADILRSGGSAHASYLAAARLWRGRMRASVMQISPYHRAQMAIERMGFRSPKLKLAIAVSNLVRDDLAVRFGLNRDRVVTLYNGVDSQRFHPSKDADASARLRAQFGISASAPTVMFVGNGFGRKGLRFLMRAMAKLPFETQLMVVGNDHALARYRDFARRLKIAPRVHFAGPRKDVEQFFAAADVFAMPSLFEPFGNVVMEAMASGLPALTTAQSGVSELMPEEMERYVVTDPTNPSEIAVRLADLLQNAPDLRATCREIAEQHSWDRYGERLIELLEPLR